MSDIQWNATFVSNTQGLPKIKSALEIGCFQGMTSKYICEHMLVPGGELFCVDPMAEVYLVENITPEAEAMNKEFTFFKGQHVRFLENTKGLPVKLIKNTFKNAFHIIAGKRFDFIYVDGDHREESVYFDAVYSFRLLQPGGYLLFDDYLWETTGIKKGIDRFINRNGDQLQVVLQNYQVLIQKNKFT